MPSICSIMNYKGIIDGKNIYKLLYEQELLDLSEVVMVIRPCLFAVIVAEFFLAYSVWK